MKVLQGPLSIKSSFKSKALKGPFTLPKSPTKHSEQAAAVNAFHHTSNASGSNISVKRKESDESDKDTEEQNDAEEMTSSLTGETNADNKKNL